MDIRQIRLFCRIVDRRSFSLAADEIHITQPAASQQIRSLERELKTTLLDRSRRTVVPTDSGQVLYRYGREILDLHERACTEILDLSELVTGRVMVGASTGPGEHVLPAMLTQFKEEYPGVSISLHVDDTHAVLERVLAREFEIGAVGAVTPRPARVAEPLARDEIVLVCSPSHPWASRDQVTLDDLVARRPRVAGAADEHDLVAGERLRDQLGSRRHGADGADLELTREHALEHGVRIVDVQRDGDARILLFELREHPGQHVLAGAGGGADHDAARDQLAEVEDLGAGALVQVEDLTAVAVQHLARVGGDDRAARAVEQGRLELALETADLLAGRRLGDVYLVGGQREAPAVDDAAEQPDLADVHKRSLSQSTHLRPRAPAVPGAPRPPRAGGRPRVTRALAGPG